MKRVYVEGLNRTKTDIVVEQVKEVLRADTLQDLLHVSLESVQRLEQLGIFKHVSLKLDTAKDSGGKAEGLEVTFIVKELGRVASSLAANAGTQSGDAVSQSVMLFHCRVLYALWGGEPHPWAFWANAVTQL